MLVRELIEKLETLGLDNEVVVKDNGNHWLPKISFSSMYDCVLIEPEE